MNSFKDWLLTLESSPTTRALSEPWAYPALYVGGDPFADTNSPQTLHNYKKMIHRDTKRKGRKKKVARPDHAIDGFVREMELLKKDLANLAAKKTSDRAKKQDKPQKPVKQEVNDDLLKTARTVLGHLKSEPNYYSRRDHVDKLAGLSKEPMTKKLSRQDFQNVAQKLGIDFNTVRFTPEAFRKAIESELTSSNKNNSTTDKVDQHKNPS